MATLPFTPATRVELARKAIHLSSLWTVLALNLLPAHLTIALFATVLAGLLLFEVARRHARLSRLVPRFLTGILRPHETRAGQIRLTGATYTLLAALGAALLLPVPAASVALLVMLVGDTAAALVGRHWGRHRIFTKSVEGSLACFLFSLLAITGYAALLPLPGGWLFPVLCAIAAGTLAEALAAQLRLDDNLAIVLAAGACLLALPLPQF